MERAGRLIGKLKLPRGVADPDVLARAAWPLAVGKRIAARTRVVSVVRATLVVEVEDLVWQRQLNTLASTIVKNLNAALGRELIGEIDFRPLAPRRLPARAETPRPAGNDEADRIEDPVLRLLYRNSRRKASA